MLTPREAAPLPAPTHPLASDAAPLPPTTHQSIHAALTVVAWLGLLWPPMRAALCPPLLRALHQGGGLEARECAAAACLAAALWPCVGEWLWAALMVGSGAAERLEATHRP